MKKLLLGTLFTFLSSGALLFNSAPDGLLHIYFLDVGQGDSILIRTPGGKNILVDGGSGQTVLSELAKVLPFFDREFEYVLLTHPDRDHIEGLNAVLRNFPVKSVIFTGVYQSNFLSETFLRIIQEKKIPIHFGSAAADLFLDEDVFLDILSPFSSSLSKSDKANETSIVARLSFGPHSILLTGDSGEETETKLLQAGASRAALLDSDVLKVGHHGSKNSSTEAFLSAVSPQTCVVSVGLNNSYHHPHPSTMKKLRQHCKKILRTDLQGRIEMIFSRDSYNISTERA